MINELVNLINVYTKLNDAEIQKLEGSIVKKHFKKNEIIFAEGRISEEIYLVSKGCVRLYYNADGNDKTAFFYLEGQFICAGESYTFNVPAKENYQAVEDSDVFVLTKKGIEELLAFSSKFEVLARIATENELITCQRIIASFVMQSAEERYLDLLKNNKPLFQRVPQQHIATYLGVSPETLSRIKKRVLKD